MSKHTIPALLAALLSPLAAQIPYGQGTPGSSGVYPRLTAGQPFLGNPAFALRIDRAKPSAAAALLLSTAPDATAFGGARIWVGLAPAQFLFAVPVTVDPTGKAAIAVPLAVAQRGLIGLRLHAQAIVADPPVGGALLATSNGLDLEVIEAPQVFLGADAHTSTNDAFVLLDPRTLAIQAQGSPLSTDGASGAAFAAGGRRLFVASSAHGTIDVADLSSGAPAWSPFVRLAAPAFGVAYDARHRLLYTVTGAPAAAKDLVVFDGNPRSPTFGTELGRVPAVTRLTAAHEWHLAATGDRLALYAGGDELVLIDSDPFSPGFLGVADRTVVPGLQPPFNALRRVHVSSDGRVVLALLRATSVAATNGLHRYDVESRRWYDHNPGLAGAQPIGPLSVPPGPMVAESDVAVARDGSFALLAEFDALVRIDLDRDDLAAWNVVRVPGAWRRSVSFGHGLTGGGRALLLHPTASNADTEAWLVDVHTARILATQRISRTPYFTVIAER